jgi:Leucine-rich repeat (LRR) protein
MPRLFVTLIAVAVAAVSSVDSHATDRAALLAFKSGVRGNLSDWGSRSPRMCNWTGVTCDSTGRVTRLLLKNSNLSGVISPSIGNLSALRKLDLRFNHLSGTIPRELGMLSQLLELRLGHNSLTGTIPEAVVCNCTSLTSIILSNNSLTGEIPFSARCRLPRLQQLSLYENRLEGGIPSPMSNFTSLSWVLLQYNRLGGVLPSQMFSKMPSLRYLYLSGNSFSSDGGNTDLEPFLASLANCTGLQELGVGSNGIGGEIPAVIGNLSSANLSLLYLDDNEITGAIPRAIGNLASLTDLELQDNMLEGPIPSELFHPRGLTKIVLSNNQINAEIPKSIGLLAQQLATISISNSGLRGEIPETLSNLTNLDYVLLDHNQLSGAIPPGGLSCQMILDLSYNKLTGQIPSGMPGLLGSFNMYLNLSNNLLEGPVSSLEFGSMEMIQALDLSGNKLSGGLPSSMGALKNLRFLDVSSNGLTGVIPRSLQGLPLQFANFSHNNFTGEVCGGGSFANLTGDSFLGNPGLCGSVPGMAPCGGRKRGRFLYIAIGVVVAVAVGLLAMVCAVVDHYLMRSSRSRLAMAAPSSLLPRFSTTGLVKATGDGEKESGEHPRISYWELADATDGFSEVNLIGKGGYGHVYRGVLHGESETVIAVKVLRQDQAAGGEVVAGSFERECRVLRSIRHRNLIRVVTACSTPEFKAVVLPFMPNGSLDSLIHGPPAAAAGGPRHLGLDLDLLLGVASNVAEGMAYLHHHAPVKVVHCDLKPSNVLLDGDMTAVVSDFGISKLVATDDGARGPEVTGEASTSSVCNSITRLLQGSVGYIAPGTYVSNTCDVRGRPATLISSSFSVRIDLA